MSKSLKRSSWIYDNIREDDVAELDGRAIPMDGGLSLKFDNKNGKSSLIRAFIKTKK